MKIDSKDFRVPPGKKVSLKRYDPRDTGKATKGAAVKYLGRCLTYIDELQNMLFADGTHGLLIVMQGIDAAGKDSLIRHLTATLNPMGFHVTAFKAPTKEEIAHDYLWRCMKACPERGTIGIFNRSHYEEILVVRVHPKVFEAQRLPKKIKNGGIWKQRYRQINSFERYLVENGIVVLKFFLNLSKDRQRERFLDRMDIPAKRWKFSSDDIQKRAFWKQYVRAYEEMLSNTSTPWAPWYILPADKKWYTRAVAAHIVVKTLQALKLSYPKLEAPEREQLRVNRDLLARKQGDKKEKSRT